MLLSRSHKKKNRRAWFGGADGSAAGHDSNGSNGNNEYGSNGNGSNGNNEYGSNGNGSNGNNEYGSNGNGSIGSSFGASSANNGSIGSSFGASSANNGTGSTGSIGNGSNGASFANNEYGSSSNGNGDDESVGTTGSMDEDGDGDDGDSMGSVTSADDNSTVDFHSVSTNGEETDEDDVADETSSVMSESTAATSSTSGDDNHNNYDFPAGSVADVTYKYAVMRMHLLAGMLLAAQEKQEDRAAMLHETLDMIETGLQTFVRAANNDAAADLASMGSADVIANQVAELIQSVESSAAPEEEKSLFLTELKVVEGRARTLQKSTTS